MSIITKGFVEGNISSKGYGKTLVVIIREPRPIGGGGHPVSFKTTDIQTKTIKIPTKKEEINVDVLFIDSTINVEAVLEAYQDRYDDIQVYLEEDVEIYD